MSTTNYFDIFKPKNGEKTNLNVMKPKVGTTASVTTVTTVTTVTEITTNSNLDLGDLTSGPIGCKTYFRGKICDIKTRSSLLL